MRYDSRAQAVRLSDDPDRNYFRICGDEFFLEGLDHASIGGNSSVFRAIHPDGDESYIVKFCRYLRESTYPRDQKRIERFEREIQALSQARSSSTWRECVVSIVDDGVFPVSARGERKTLRYYVMEEAESDLYGFLEKNMLGFSQKLLLCKELMTALKGIHDIGIYHRDIKPGNILISNGKPVFSDLGLINFREQDQDIDHFDERIGPIGYLSPEATNKHLAIRSRPEFAFDCWIDEKSDLFQLGQIFWLILQDEVPTGHLDVSDVRTPSGGFFESVIQPMLQYSKDRRSSLTFVEESMAPLMKEFAVS